MKKMFLFILIGSALFAQNKTYTQRADSVLALMTLEEKVGQLVQYSGDWATGAAQGRPSETSDELLKKGKIGSFLNVVSSEKTMKLQKIAVEQSRLKIPLIFGLDVIHGYFSTFPVPIGEASSWNPTLIEKSARMQAIEASSAGIHWTFNPMVDIARDPRWGRIMEGSGEDPYLGSLMAAARVRGYQGKDLSANNTILACVKHYAAYGGAEGGRDYNTVDLSERNLREFYLLPYKAAVEAGAGSLMASFNEIGGVPSSASKFLMTDILRGEWKSDAFVVSDWNSIGELIPHGVAKDRMKAAELGIKATVDMDMETSAYFYHLAELVKEGKVDIKLVDDAVRRVLIAKFKLGLFDDPYKYCNVEREKKTIKSKEIVDATREVAQETLVLLKNEKNILPLSKSLKSIALIGPLVKSKDNPLGGWSALGDSNDVVSVYEGLTQKLGKNVKINYAEGCTILGKNKSGFATAVKAAKASEVVVVFVGEHRGMSGEANSRATLDLPGVQEDLVKELKKTGKPVVVVLMNGRPLTIPWLQENVNAIIEAWYPGISAGIVIADALFGDLNPNGKLTVTFPRYVGQVPIYYNYKNTGRPHDPTNHYTSYYMDLENSPLYPFGYGLSYTTFEYSAPTLSKTNIKKDESLTVTVEVKNTGKFEGKEVVQLYIRDLVGSVTRPVKELKDFAKISLKPGETKKVEFTITPEKFKFYDINLKHVVEPGDFKVFVGTNSVDVKEASFTVVE
ncbi:MAG: glycosyl hydrolase [Stygiobacter sp. RIFOXYC12_FULL_38_8]|nr:MAG: glycosyl hydrolase [Stygiobacter sp. RIFOXYA12_FULL_38_9]OGV09519.1 MAG: glycosyl hydrolase [Stygiobacter sp. RIFOXYB2_FULL_37_11]OGV10077.1 MAG: glycosyl hydrolase [Stygiobacter sp. RIFOXYA2_FULL_38_8]OGV16654.1 MAG: glycosyl hydrolase [Stygiobacter sp. RIFOXYC2_FULL_38_25]OGV22613.1 MAG: glycosyl hydrolase [Stygiobacter sp. RIFOXYC12_FULL_38_8]OGV81199.1 MAG: glycosyl hydrolase [Stygiobacter sp. GWF2_38_21]RJQ59688.1 MAG: glycosyl hydrolase [Stygiobacter sp.]